MPEKQVKKQAKAGRGIINDKMKAAQFEKGQSGNPKGRPKKGTAIADILNKLLDTPKDNKTRREIILDKVLTMAESGDMAAINFIADRTEGKALERIVTQETDELVILE